jgi:hypothetical protein
MYTAFTAEKVAELFGLLLQFSQRLPTENSHPIGENSPNLVTLDTIMPDVNYAVVR